MARGGGAGGTGALDGAGGTGALDGAGATILVVDDDAAVRDTVVDGLTIAGYRTLQAVDGATALDAIVRERPDLVILDRTMPHVDGMAVLARLRAAGNRVPVIVLTARHDQEDRVAGLREGADDYVGKPFGLEELLLRVGAVLRRRTAATDGATPALVCGAIAIDPDGVRASAGGAPLELSPTEYRLLVHLVEHKERVRSKEQLLDAVWGVDFDASTAVVDTYVSYLRRKLGPHAAHLVTVRGFGVKMTEQP
ncbi:MAG: Transcriptional regulatory protein PrrA [Actinomycetota bacterium]